MEQRPGGFADGAVVCEDAIGLRAAGLSGLLTEDVKQKVSCLLMVPTSTLGPTGIVAAVSARGERRWTPGVKFRKDKTPPQKNEKRSLGRTPHRRRKRRKVGGGVTLMTRKGLPDAPENAEDAVK